MFRRVWIIAVLVVMIAIIPAGAQETDMNQLAIDNSQAAFDLYQQIVTGENGNVFFSPYSISQALAMTYAGARGETESQMADVLHFSLPQDQLHPAFNALHTNLTERQRPVEPGSEDAYFALHIANRLWGQIDFPFDPNYMATLDQNYGAGLELVDFVTQAEAAREEINTWVADQTEDRIKDIVPPGLLNAMTRLVLANAIYFNAAWLNQFSENLTQDAPFTLLDGETVTVPMMFQLENFRYLEGEGYTAIELPYIGGDTAMIILLPDEGNFEAFEAELTNDTFQTARESMQGGSVQLYMPRFEFETSLNLSQTLVDMGMPAAFSGDADFTGMFDATQTDENLFISSVLHKAFVKVDEEGTEAAAATVIVMEATSAMPAEPVEIRIDRPFIFSIYDRQTGSILFIGRVLNPAAD